MLSRLRNRYDHKDVQVTLTANPLNWACQYSQYHDWGRCFEFGPISVLVLF